MFAARRSFLFMLYQHYISLLLFLLLLSVAFLLLLDRIQSVENPSGGAETHARRLSVIESAGANEVLRKPHAIYAIWRSNRQKCNEMKCTLPGERSQTHAAKERAPDDRKHNGSRTALFMPNASACSFELRLHIAQQRDDMRLHCIDGSEYHRAHAAHSRKIPIDLFAFRNERILAEISRQCLREFVDGVAFLSLSLSFYRSLSRSIVLSLVLRLYSELCACDLRQIEYIE